MVGARKSSKRQSLAGRLPVIAAPLLVLFALLSQGALSDAPDIKTRHPLIIAHGGGQGLAPPNSLAALTVAHKVGADVLEVDVHLSADGVPVLIHDETVDRTTTGTGAIEAMTLAEIKALPLKGDPTLTIPTLGEALALFPEARWVMEIKLGPKALPQRLCETLVTHDAAARTLVASFHPQALEDFRAQCPEVLTSLHREEVARFVKLQKLGLSRFARFGGVALHVPEREGWVTIVTPRFVRAAHARGLEVHVWTVNEKADMDRLFAMGVDGVFTDYPDRGLEVASHYLLQTE